MEELIKKKIKELEGLVSSDSFGGHLTSEKKLFLKSLKELDVGSEEGVKSIEEAYKGLYKKYESWRLGRKYGGDITKLAVGVGFIKAILLLPKRGVDTGADKVKSNKRISDSIEDLTKKRAALFQSNNALKLEIKRLKEKYESDVNNEKKEYKNKKEKLDKKEQDELETAKRLHIQSMEAFEERETEEVKGVNKMKSATLQAGVNIQISENNAAAKEKAEQVKMEQLGQMLSGNQEGQDKKKIINKSEVSEEIIEEPSEISQDAKIKTTKVKQNVVYLDLDNDGNYVIFKKLLRNILESVGQNKRDEILKIYKDNTKGKILNVSTFQKKIQETYGISASLFNPLLDGEL